LTAARADTTNVPSTSAVPSTINPAGIRDDKRNLFAMVLIPLRKQHFLPRNAKAERSHQRDEREQELDAADAPDLAQRLDVRSFVRRLSD
jgi:hypothetical protein